MGAPVQHHLAVERAHLGVEEPLLVADGGDDAAGVAVRHVGHHLGEELEADEEGVQRVLAELVAAAEDVGEERAVVVDRHLEQRAGELVLVAEMVEEAALGDLGGGDDLLDRGGVEALGEDRLLRDVEDAPAGLLALRGGPRQLCDCTHGTVSPMARATHREGRRATR